MKVQAASLSISQCEQSNESSVWVLNTSGSNGTSKGIINVTITEGNGRATVVRIPQTAIPVDLTTQATKSALMMSPDFRRIAAARIVRLISDADAMKMLDNDEARAEQRRLLNVDLQHEVQNDQLPREVQAMQAEAQGNIGGFALNIAHTAEGDEEAICANLRNNADSLSAEELQYIVNTSELHKVKMTAAELAVR